MSRSGTSPRLRVEYPDGVPDSELAKALEATARKLRGERKAVPLTGLTKQNPAAKHLIGHVQGSFDQMVRSLEREVKKVLEPKEQE